MRKYGCHLVRPQRPVIPAIAPQDPRLQQIHSAAYFNPEQLPEGAVLVVGAGSSGVQIAEELMRAGRKVYLSVGAHDRPPRAYRNREIIRRIDAGEGFESVRRSYKISRSYLFRLLKKPI